MGIVKTSVFLLEAPDDNEPLGNWAGIARRNSAVMDASMAQLVTPPGIPALNAEIAARQAADTALTTRVTALEATAWATLPLVGTAVMNHDPSAGQPQCQYRVEGRRVFLRGWAFSSAGAAANAVISTALPVALRPTAAATMWPIRGNGVVRWDLSTAGILTAVDALAASTYVNLNAVTWPLS